MSERTCYCGSTNFEKLENRPVTALLPIDMHFYADFYVCIDCGDVSADTPTQEEISDARDDYINILVENEVIDEEETHQYF